MTYLSASFERKTSKTVWGKPEVHDRKLITENADILQKAITKRKEWRGVDGR
jgi:hypothetical protein